MTCPHCARKKAERGKKERLRWTVREGRVWRATTHGILLSVTTDGGGFARFTPYVQLTVENSVIKGDTRPQLPWARKLAEAMAIDAIADEIRRLMTAARRLGVTDEELEKKVRAAR